MMSGGKGLFLTCIEQALWKVDAGGKGADSRSCVWLWVWPCWRNTAEVEAACLGGGLEGWVLGWLQETSGERCQWALAFWKPKFS